MHESLTDLQQTLSTIFQYKKTNGIKSPFTHYFLIGALLPRIGLNMSLSFKLFYYAKMKQKFDETQMDSPELMEYEFKRKLIIPV